jgi:phosphoribosylaminoimidazole-succinocarboxamide synthase
LGLDLQPHVLLNTELPGYKLLARGKVRDVYEAPTEARTGPAWPAKQSGTPQADAEPGSVVRASSSEDGSRLLIVATDRISAFDFILATGIPDKGRVLTQMTLFWLDFLRGVVPNHFLSADTGELPPEFKGRSMWVRRAEMFQVECVARGYLAGSGWKDYQRTGAVCGIPLPSGLRESDALPQPLFTPATKAQSGHDENISFEQAAAVVGAETAAKLRDLTLALYSQAAEYARTRGIIIADTKFEFGVVDGHIILADEVLTPDSSRFWPADQYRPGQSQPSYDKQYVRDYLESIHWNKQPPAPGLPEDVARRTSEKYKEAYRALTGHELEPVA